jgi:hypothetical protein
MMQAAPEICTGTSFACSVAGMQTEMITLKYMGKLLVPVLQGSDPGFEIIDLFLKVIDLGLKIIKGI